MSDNIIPAVTDYSKAAHIFVKKVNSCGAAYYHEAIASGKRIEAAPATVQPPFLIYFAPNFLIRKIYN
jgi:hypothetical protein